MIIKWTPIILFLSIIIKCSIQFDGITELNKSTYEVFINLHKICIVFVHIQDSRIYNDTLDSSKSAIEIIKKKSLQNIEFGVLQLPIGTDSLSGFTFTDQPFLIFINNESEGQMSLISITNNVVEIVNKIEPLLPYTAREISYEEVNRNLTKNNDKDKGNALLFLGNVQEYHEQFNKIMKSAKRCQIDELVYSNNKQLLHYFQLSDHGQFYVLLFKQFIGIFDVTKFELIDIKEEDFNSGDFLDHVLLLYSSNFYENYTQDHESLIMSGIPVVTIVHNYSFNSSDHVQLLKTAEHLGRKYIRKLKVLIADYSSSSYINKFKTSFRINEEELPIICLTSTEDYEQSNLDKYRLSFSERVIKYQALLQFIQNWKNNKIAKFFVSEEIPENPFTNHNIRTLVRDNYLTSINPENHHIVFICQDRFKICEEAHQVYSQLSSLYERRDNKVIFSMVDSYKNELDFLDIKRLPTLFVYPVNGQQTLEDRLIEFKGNFTINSMQKFLTKHLQLYTNTNIWNSNEENIEYIYYNEYDKLEYEQNKDINDELTTVNDHFIEEDNMRGYGQEENSSPLFEDL